MEYTDGRKYDGDFMNGKMCGNGKMTFPNGLPFKVLSFDGEWENNKPHGKGKEIRANGDVYEGDFIQGKRHGKGKYTTPGYSYEGEWINNQRHGKGKSIINSNGETYDGNFVRDKRHGQGKTTYTDGSVYEGYYQNDKKHGKGKYTNVHGSFFEGEWENGGKHGTFKLTESNGDQYEIIYSHGKRQSKKRFATLVIDERPSQRRRIEEPQQIAVLKEEHIVCPICGDNFSFNMNTDDDDVKGHLPVVGLCQHKCCLGCILKQQAACAENNGGDVRETVDCMECRRSGAFTPGEPNYHTLLIDLLEHSIPVRGAPAAQCVEANPERTFTRQEMNLLQVEDTWIGCDNCGKYRMLPPDISAEEVEALPDEWYCKDNIWDPARSTCNAEERSATWMVKYYERKKREEDEDKVQSQAQSQGGVSGSNSF